MCMEMCKTHALHIRMDSMDNRNAYDSTSTHNVCMNHLMHRALQTTESESEQRKVRSNAIQQNTVHVDLTATSEAQKESE